CLQVLDFPFTF
nr:immunoglobulin light chain junction region [Macaca mulatta]